MYEKIIIKRMFKDKSDISRWNYKRAFKAFLKELRDLESFTSLSRLFHSLTALYENVRWPVDVLNLGITCSVLTYKKRFFSSLGHAQEFSSCLNTLSRNKTHTAEMNIMIQLRIIKHMLYFENLTFCK